MSDAELARIRQARIDEIKKQREGSQASGGPAKSQAAPEDDVYANLISQLLQPTARERLNRIAMVRPERARQVEQLLIRMGQTGQLQQKVSEPELVSLLNQISRADNPATKVVFDRRHESDPEDEDVSSRSVARDSGDQGATAAADDDDDFFD